MTELTIENRSPPPTFSAEGDNLAKRNGTKSVSIRPIENGNWEMVVNHKVGGGRPDFVDNIARKMAANVVEQTPEKTTITNE